MLNHAEFLSDAFARKVSFAGAIEARTKIVFTALALVLNLLSTNVYTPATLAVFSIVCLLCMRIPPRLILLRLVIPIMMAAVVLATQLFFYGETPLFIIHIWGLSLVGYKEGLAYGFLIMCRVLSGVSLILLLSMSTPADRLFRAAMWFRLPGVFIEISLLVYRYIFVLAEELIIMRDAQRVRLGYRTWRLSMKSISTLGASVILRAYDRAERVFEAMLVRGYSGRHHRVNYAFGRKDSAIALCLVLVLVGLYLIGRFIP